MLTGKVAIRVVCTDRGQHNIVPFGVVEVWRSEARGWRAKSDRVLQRSPSASRDGYVDLDDMSGERLQRTFTFRCDRCRRNTPVRQDRLEQACIAIAEADMPSKLDVSLI
ncbi:hypothetical protein BOH72_11215 [Mycobacterium sp. WY10]|nr:hypothetical protein BOH72_11215 [Mycobacterium sp. WY10]